MSNLLNRMNEPDPRDVRYLERGRNSFKLWDEKPVLQKSPHAIHDIAEVHDRLIMHG